MSLTIQAMTLRPAQLRALAQRHRDRYPVLFESTAQGPLGSWTVLPIATSGALWLAADGLLHARDLPVDAAQGGFLATLDAWWRASRQPATRGLPGPWRPGWTVWLGYEIAREVEPSLRLPASGLPIDAQALRTPAALLYDHGSGEAWAVAEEGQQALLEQASRDLQDLPQQAKALPVATRAIVQSGSLQEAPAQHFLDAVAAAKDAISAGTVYQVNLSRNWTAQLAAGANGGDVYERLRAANPAPFAAWAQLSGFEILSSSPERLLRIAGGEASTRPIAGTRPRSGDAAFASAETAALLASDKERAEHVMLIDLGRNDLGRVCIAGSVQVSEFMAVESYAHVHHIVSNVHGRLCPDVTPVDALRAVFPGGTITGCPKVRCMSLIAELEGSGRGAYTGSLGWLGRDGSADFNILIRTVTLAENRLEFRAGAGIVADSVPELELQETRAKALGMLRALERSR